MYRAHSVVRFGLPSAYEMCRRMRSWTHWPEYYCLLAAESQLATEEIKISFGTLHEQHPDRTPVSSPVIVQGGADRDIIYIVAIEVPDIGNCMAELVTVGKVAIEVISAGYFYL